MVAEEPSGPRIYGDTSMDQEAAAALAGVPLSMPHGYGSDALEGKALTNGTATKQQKQMLVRGI